jgi:phosphatidate cytidylyltransferase
MLKLRVLTAAVLLLLVLAAMFLLPAVWWQLALIAPLIMAGHEWSRLAGFSRASEAAFLCTLVAGGVVVWLAARPGPVRAGYAVVASHAVHVCSAAFWLVIVPCWLWLKLKVRNRLALAAAGLLVLLPAWLALAQLQSNPNLLLCLLAVVWIADTAAYFAGRAFGRHKLAPAISPGKTWEGVAGAFAAVTVYAAALHFARLPADEFYFVIGAFFCMTAFSIVGDLFESWMKRGAGVKDSGAILPGHGGMLDRIDGMVAALPLAALIFA